MTERSRPWDGTAVGDAAEAPYDAGTEWARVMRATSFASETNANKGGVVMDATGFNDYAVTTSSPNNARVQTGLGLVQGTWHESDANVDIAIPTPIVSTRVDRIVLRKSWANQTVRITRIAGTEGAGVPALTQVFGATWDVPLWQVSIVITTGAITYTDDRLGVGAGHARLVAPTATSGLTVSTGNVGIGTAPLPQYGIIVAPTLTGSTTQQMARLTGVFDSGATVNAVGIAIAMSTAAASYTIAAYQAIDITNLSKGAGSAVTDNYGVRIAAMTAGATNNYGIHIGTPSGGSTNNIAIRLLGGTPAIQIDAGGVYVVAGGVGIGSAPGTSGTALYVTGTTTLSGNVGVATAPSLTAGLAVFTTITSSAGEAHGIRVFVTPTAASSAALLTGIRIGGTFAPGGQTSVVAAGLYVDAITGAQANNYGVFVTAPTGATSTNIGVYISGGSPGLYVNAGGITTAAGTITFTGTNGAMAMNANGNELTFSRAGANYIWTTSASGTLNLGSGSRQTDIVIATGGGVTIAATLDVSAGQTTLTGAGATTATDSLVARNSGSFVGLRVNNSGSVVLGFGAPATTATDGFPYIPKMAGAPTGVPTTSGVFSGSVPCLYDATNNQIYVYNGAWKKTAVLT